MHDIHGRYEQRISEEDATEVESKTNHAEHQSSLALRCRVSTAHVVGDALFNVILNRCKQHQQSCQMAKSGHEPRADQVVLNSHL